jgi:hypothetical protein
MKTTSLPLRGRRRPLLALTVPLLALAFLPAPLGATNYYFSQNGDNSKDGLTPQTAKKDFNIAMNFATPGNAVLFRRGDTWAAPGNSINLVSLPSGPGSEIYIGAYTEPGSQATAKPIISTLFQEENRSGSVWSRVGSTNTWQKPVTYSDAWRVYVNGASKAKILTTNPNDVNQPYEWYIQPLSGSSGMLYVNTGPTGNAPVNVDVQTKGTSPVLKISGTNYVMVQNIDFRGGSQTNVVEVDAPCVQIEIDNCDVKQGRWNGILVTNLGSSTGAFVNGIKITNCTVDRIWTHEEDNVFYTGGDGIVLQHAVEDGLVFNNTVQNWAHTGIEVAAYRGGFYGVHNVIVEQNKVSAGSSGYMHAFSVYGYEGGATDITVRRNFFHDYTSTCHAMGNGNKYYSNIFARVRRTALTLTDPQGNQHSKQPYGVDMAPWVAYKAVSTDPTVWMVAHDNVVANNTFYDVDEWPIYLYQDPNGPVVSQNAFYNNLIVFYGDGLRTPDVGLLVQPQVTGGVYARNNNFWDSGVAHPESVSVASYKGTLYNAAGLTNIGTPRQYCSDNHQDQTILANTANNVFSLPSNAPQWLKDGGMNLMQLLGPDFTDYEGNAWHSQPSIGAIQSP